MMKVSAIGRLGRDPETRAVGESKRTVCKFSIAVDDFKDGVKSTTWVNVSVWGKDGERCQANLRKGSQVDVTGRLALREYTGKDGTKKTSAEVDSWYVGFLSGFGKQKDEPGKENGFQPQQDDGDVPF